MIRLSYDSRRVNTTYYCNNVPRAVNNPDHLVLSLLKYRTTIITGRGVRLEQTYFGPPKHDHLIPPQEKVEPEIGETQQRGIKRPSYSSRLSRFLHAGGRRTPLCKVLLHHLLGNVTYMLDHHFLGLLYYMLPLLQQEFLHRAKELCLRKRWVACDVRAQLKACKNGPAANIINMEQLKACKNGPAAIE
jgi:hypothetical protein